MAEKQKPEPIILAETVLVQISAESPEKAAELRAILPALAMKLFQQGADWSEDALRDYAQQGAEAIRGLNITAKQPLTTPDIYEIHSRLTGKTVAAPTESLFIPLSEIPVVSLEELWNPERLKPLNFHDAPFKGYQQLLSMNLSDMKAYIAKANQNRVGSEVYRALILALVHPEYDQLSGSEKLDSAAIRKFVENGTESIFYAHYMNHTVGTIARHPESVEKLVELLLGAGLDNTDTAELMLVLQRHITKETKRLDVANTRKLLADLQTGCGAESLATAAYNVCYKAYHNRDFHYSSPAETCLYGMMAQYADFDGTEIADSKLFPYIDMKGDDVLGKNLSKPQRHAILNLVAEMAPKSPLARYYKTRTEMWATAFRTLPSDTHIILMEDFKPAPCSLPTLDCVNHLLQREQFGYSMPIGMANNAAHLFGTVDRVARYLEKWGQQGHQPLHDLTYMIANMDAPGIDIKAWGDAVLRFGPEMAKMTRFAKDLSKPPGSLRETRVAARQFAFEGAENYPQLAELAIEHALSRRQIEAAKTLMDDFTPKTRTLPALNIDGDAFGMPKHRFFLLPDGDVRGLFLGEMTGCCQSLGSDGLECAEHGFTSPHGGFYVLTDPHGNIIAQSWAWRGEKGEMVLDSLERKKGRVSSQNWDDIIGAMKAEIPFHLHDITHLMVGAGGATERSKNLHSTTMCAKPLDYNGYRDSHTQYFVTDLKPLTPYSARAEVATTEARLRSP